MMAIGFPCINGLRDVVNYNEGRKAAVATREFSSLRGIDLSHVVW